MMTTQAYLLAWMLYLLAAGGLLVVAWRISRRWRPDALRIAALALAAAWLLTPALVEPGVPRETLAPAWIVLAFEWWDGGYAQAQRVLYPLLVLAAAAVPAALAGHWAWLRRQARQATPAAEPAVAPARREPTL